MLKILITLAVILPIFSAQAFGPKRLKEEDCYERPSILDRLNPFAMLAGPADIFGNQACQKLLTLKELPVDPSCGDNISMQVIYPDFNGDYSMSPLTTNSGQFIIHGTGKHAYSQYKPGPQLVSEIRLEKTALDRFYCHKKYPQKTSEVFAEGFDVPAATISLWTRGYIESRWKPRLEALLAKYPNYDLVSLYELNLKAADLWASYLACFNGDAEKARAAYFKGEFICDNSDVDGKALKVDTATFVHNFSTFFDTSYFKKPEILVNNSYDLEYKLRRGDDIAKIEIGELTSMHPLFVQVAMQVLSDIYHPGGATEDELQAKIATGQITQRGFIALSQFFSMWTGTGCDTLGLWPSAGRAVFSSIVLSTLQSMAAMTKGRLRAVDYNVQAVGCKEGYRLPYIYSDDKATISRDFAKITSRYR
jgi:hypothetical protein